MLLLLPILTLVSHVVADGFYRGAKLVKLKEIADAALKECANSYVFIVICFFLLVAFVAFVTCSVEGNVTMQQWRKPLAVKF